MSLFNSYQKTQQMQDNIIKENTFFSEKKINKICNTLKELKVYFPESSDLLDTYIEKLNLKNYSSSIEYEIKEKIFYDVIGDKRKYTSNNEIINKFANLNSSIMIKEKINNLVIFNESTNKYKIYGLSLNKDYCDEKSKDVFFKIFDDLFNGYDKSILERLDLEKQEIDSQISKDKKDILEKDFDTYYGTTDFMLDRISFINDCVNKIIDSDLVRNDIRMIFQEVPKILNSFQNEFNDKTKELTNPYKYYEEVEKFFINTVNLENELSVCMQPIWDDYLTDPSDYKEGEPFRFLIHVLSSGYVEPSLLNKTCCTLITNNCMPFPSYGEYGYIMKFDVNNLGLMCYDDAGSWLISKEEFIGRNFPMSWQLSEKQGDNFVWYENSNISKLVLPWIMEKEMIKNNTKYHDNPLNECNCYSEAFLLSKKDFPLMPLAMFAKNDSSFDEISEIDNGLLKLKIDLNVYRRNAGLEPINNTINK